MTKSTPPDFVKIYHPDAGESSVHPRSVKVWEQSGWSTTKTKPKAETAGDEPALADQAPASSEPPTKAGRRAGRTPSTPPASTPDASAEASAAPDATE